MKKKRNATNQSVSRFLDDLDRRDEERRKDRIETLKHPRLDDEEENKIPMGRKENACE